MFLTGTQALVRLPMMQRQRDAAAGLDTACFVSGYRGSPLGGLDRELWRAQPFLDDHHIHFQPGVNEDLAATAVWGSQQTDMSPGSRYDGVFAMWYGKGPGVDRSGDVIKHGNLAGSSRHGGVLLLAGDDHLCKSSTTAHQSEFAFIDASVPVLHPAGVQEVLDYGLYGWALSRYSGCWVAFKLVTDLVDSSASVAVDPERVGIVMPEDFAPPADGLNIRWPDNATDQEHRLRKHKLEAARAFVRANRLDRVVLDAPRRCLGIVTTGKPYLDVRQALDDLGIDEAEAASLGLAIYKVAMPWPLEPERARDFAQSAQEILVVEEKRSLIEAQLKEQLYHLPADARPRIVGKHDERGAELLSSTGELTPGGIARVIVQRPQQFAHAAAIERRLLNLDVPPPPPAASVQRVPYFCSGCPHNVSTRVPDGSRALAGIGCHYMAMWMDRATGTFTHMGAEGVNWVGLAPFTDEPHVFVNLGDGTYFHSGSLAIRQAVAAGVCATYKILYNDAVAMTGGQPVDGQLSVAQITQQLYAEGVRRIAVVAEDPGRYNARAALAPDVSVHDRGDFGQVQRGLRDTQGVSVLIYDQTCAAEKRRRRKRGLMADPPVRAVIDEAVCEGCGDCSVKSNCLFVVPIDTPYGRKRAIDQQSCNKDMACVDGFCPSFVTVHGGKLRKPPVVDADFPLDLPEPALAAFDTPYGILITGIGGTGVVTIGALLGMAAHLEHKGCTVLDMTGLAQKGGAVLSHVRIANRPEDIHAARITAGSAHVLIACDLVVAANADAQAKLHAGLTRAVVNSHHAITGDFTRDPDKGFPNSELERTVAAAVGHADFHDATRLALALCGDAMASNVLLLGVAWQKGLLPLSHAAIDRAVELNGVAVEQNKRAFLWGRRIAVAPERVAALIETPAQATDESLDAVIARRTGYLRAYQDDAYARSYNELVDAAREAEAAHAPGNGGLADAIARNYFKPLAYKDEYEVARLYTDGTFKRRVADQFDGDVKLRFHLAPPLLARRDPATGVPRKSSDGAWMMTAFRALAPLKRLRGTRFDPFGYTAERRAERALIADYEAAIGEVLGALTLDNHALAVDIASVPERIRGFGHIKMANIAKDKEARGHAAKRISAAPPTPWSRPNRAVLARERQLPACRPRPIVVSYRQGAHARGQSTTQPRKGGTMRFTPITTAFVAATLLAGMAMPAQSQSVLRIANMGEPETLDPHHASGTWENRILGDMFIGLTTEAADASVIPGAAERWDVSEDGITYTFTLRDHVWSDGTPVTADDFVFSLRRILAPETAAKYASILYPIKNAEALNGGEMTGMDNLGVRAIDARTLEITLESPTPYFVSQLTHYTAWPVPKHVVEALSDDWVKPGNMVSNGPFTLAEWTPNSQIRVVKNPSFYDADNVALDEVIYYPGEDRAAAQQRFRAGEVDVSTDFASDQIEWLRENLAAEIRIAPYLGIYYYPFNTAKPPFDDVRTRVALSMVVDRAAITDKVLRTGEVPAYSFVPPGTDNYGGGPSYVTWKDLPYAERVEQAMSLLAEAGYGPNNPLEVTLRYNTSENHKKIAIAVASMWSQIGVKAELYNSEVSVHYSDLQAGNFEVARAGWIADYNDPQNFLFLLQQSTGPLNYGNYNNGEFESLMQQAAQTIDLSARAGLLARAEAIVMEEQATLPIYYYVSKNLVGQHVKGWADNTKDTHRRRWISIER